MRRLVALAAVASLLAVAVCCTEAGASGNLGWRLTAYGSADCDQNANHTVCFRYPAGGGEAILAANSWHPWWCQILWIADGDAAGTPEQIVWASTDPYQQCVPWGGAWGNGFGYAEGVMTIDGRVAVAEPFYIFPRDSAWPWATGTRWRIY